MKLHGALGTSNEMPIAGMWLAGASLGLADGPTEVHKSVVARQLLKKYRPNPEMFPDYVRWKAQEKQAQRVKEAG